jgi:hypothetical protein
VQQLETMLAVLRKHMAVAACENYRHLRVKATNFLAEFKPAHAGHHHVRKHDVEASTVFAKLLKRSLRIEGMDAIVTKLLEGTGERMVENVR